MQKQFLLIVCLLLCLLITSCFQNHRLIKEKIEVLRNKDEITILTFGNSISPESWGTGRGYSYGSFLKTYFAENFNGTVSLINSCKEDETFNSAARRIEEDVASYSPDIVFIMLGLADANVSGVPESIFRQSVKEFFDKIQEYNLFVVVLTSTGYAMFNEKSDPRYDRLNMFNEIILWEAGLHEMPMIDVAGYTERLRISGPMEYRRMFVDDLHLNAKGNKYIADYIINILNTL